MIIHDTALGGRTGFFVEVGWGRIDGTPPPFLAPQIVYEEPRLLYPNATPCTSLLPQTWPDTPAAHLMRGLIAWTPFHTLPPLTVKGPLCLDVNKH